MTRSTPSTPTGPLPVAPGELDRHLLLEGSHRDPHGVLGPHRRPDTPGTVVVRALQPGADAVDVVVEQGPTAGRYPLAPVGTAGVFAGTVPGPLPHYRLAVRRTDESGGETHGDEVETIVDDPYRFSPVLGPVDLHLIGEGRHERLWDALGAHFRRWPTPSGPVEGTSFTVWAPNARGVRVVGDWAPENGSWDGVATPMRALGSGVWEIFLPGVGTGTRYGFRILTADGHWLDKADPMAFAADLPADAGLRRHHLDPRVDRRVVDGAARRLEPPRRADERLRDACRLVAPGPELRGPGRGAGRVPDRAGLHPRRAAAGGRAPVRRVLGLPGQLLLRADLALRDPGRLPGLRRHPPPRGHRGHRRLGPGPLPPRRVGARPLRRHALLRARRSRAAASSSTGARSSSTSGAPRSGTSSSPTPCTGSRSSTSTACGWTPSPRCSTWTTRARTAAGCPTSTAAARTSRRCRSSRSSTPPSTRPTPAS